MSSHSQRREHRWQLLLLLLVLVASSALSSERGRGRVSAVSNNKTGEASERDAKTFSLFQIVSFPNDVCSGSGSTRNGTCYTSDECSAKSGSASGSCANGFGVCCIINLSCGGMSSENNTYLTESSATGPTSPTPCVYTVCPTSSDICRIKLDMTTFNIAGPYAGTTVEGAALTTNVRAIGDCTTDTFTVTNPGGNAPPVICGYNTGQHMILDASDQCHKVSFDIRGTGTTRSWDIAVTQHSCTEAEAVAGPPGCLQYYTGATNTFASFNWPQTYAAADSTTHLSSQDYSICIRTEKSYCAICYIAAIAPATANKIATSFGVSISSAGTTTSKGAVGSNCLTDYITIDGAMDDVAATMFSVDTWTVSTSRICGRYLAAVNAVDDAQTNSVCTKTKPFRVGVKFDEGEIGDSADAAGSMKASVNEANQGPGGIIGFDLRYIQIAC